MNDEAVDVAELAAASLETALKLYKVHAIRPERETSWLVTRELVSVSVVEEANTESAEYQSLVEADSFVVQLIVAVVVAVLVAIFVIDGAVISDVVNVHVELFVIPSK